MTTRIARIVDCFMLASAPSLAEFAADFEGPDGPDMLKCVLFSSLAEYLDCFFMSDDAKAPLACAGLSGSAAGPMTPGTAFSKFYQSTGELTSYYGAWAFAQGGIGSVPAALADAVRSRGGEIVLEAEVMAIQHRGGCPNGVVLADGREIRSGIVLSNARSGTNLPPAAAALCHPGNLSRADRPFADR